MKRLHTYTYKIRTLLVLVPLMLLAISTWALNKVITPSLPDELRAEFLLSARIFCPGLFAVAVAFVVPTFDRFLQISMVAITYVMMLLFIPTHTPSIFTNPIICVIASISSLFAFLPYASRDEGFISHTRRVVLALFFAITLPVIAVISVTIILRQMNIYVLFSFDETFGRSFLSVIYVPIYLTLQALGFQDIVGDLITLRYQNNMVTSFVNAIIVTNLLSLPATLFIRSLFTKQYVRLFLTLLVVITLLTSSIGACVSLTWLLLLVFYPGTFGVLLCSSMVCFAISYIMQVPAITSVDNLYLPDVNLAHTLLFYSSPVTWLEIFAIFIPMFLVLLLMLIKRDQSYNRKTKLRSINFGYTVSATSSPELRLIAMLRALGGISNISEVEEDGTWLYIQVVARERISFSTLSMLMQDKILVDRVNKLYLCDVGELSHFFYQRLSMLIENQFGEEEYEVPLSVPFTIRSMPHPQADAK